MSSVSEFIPATRTTSVRRLRVAQVVTKFTAGAGGIALRGALGLDPERYASTILTADGGSLIGEAEQAGLEVIRLRHLAGGRGIYPRGDALGVRELVTHLRAGHFDIVHTHSAKAGGIGRLAARKAGVPAIVHTFHGFPFHAFQSPGRRRALIEIERRAARFTDYFMAAGTMVAAEAVRLRLAQPDRIRAFATVAIDGRIGAATEASRRVARRRLGIADGVKVIGTVARLDDQKRPGDMVAAVAALGRDDVVMVWVGDGELRGETERLIARHALQDRFLLLGQRADVHELLPAFDVFALSSVYEGLPCAIVEAMACGLPVVATAVNSVPELVIAGKNGLLVRPADPASLAGALRYLLERPDEAAAMAMASRMLLGARFRPEALCEDLMAIYPLALRNGAERTAGQRR